MAKATATCTCAACGKTFEKIMYGGNRRDADSKAEWASTHFDECEDCYAARKERERDEANAAAEKAAKEAGLPELTGTEKQVAWATTLRAKAYNAIMGAVESLERKGRDSVDGKVPVNGEMVPVKFKAREFATWLFSAHAKASWWIDNKGQNADNSFATLNNYVQGNKAEWAEYLKNRPVTETPAETETRRAAEAEMVSAPENQTHAGTVEITVTEKEVSAQYQKDDDFRGIVKSLGYHWNADRRLWYKAINITTGTAQERAAELGSNLLNAGFAVRIADPETRAAAVNGDYQPEHRRWVTAYFSGAYKGWFCIRLPERGDGMYEKAKAIKGSRYCKPNVAVPAQQWREVLDFAELNDYRISPAAQKIIDAQQAAVIVVAPAPAKAAVYHETDPAELMGGGADVLDDLRDD